jgi:hypothetical protein
VLGTKERFYILAKAKISHRILDYTDFTPPITIPETRGW